MRIWVGFILFFILSFEVETLNAQECIPLKHTRVRYLAHEFGPNKCIRNFKRELRKLPNDAAYSKQWHLPAIAAPAAWDLNTGSSDTIVAIIDTGIDINHPDLKLNLWKNPGEIPNNSLDDDHNGYIDDYRGANMISNDGSINDTYGHGTAISGIIGAKGNNTIGVSGISWDTTILPLNFLANDGSVNDIDAIEAIDYILTQKANGQNIVAVNASWGGPDNNPDLELAIRKLGDAGILMVVAAGNSFLNNDFVPDYPSVHPLLNIISVGASDKFENLATFSNYGPKTVDLIAPGDSIFTTSPTSSFEYVSGTSFAAPMVTGAVALVASLKPELSWYDRRLAILNGAKPSVAFNGITKFGALVNLKAALDLAKNITPSAPPSPLGLNALDEMNIQIDQMISITKGQLISEIKNYIKKKNKIKKLKAQGKKPPKLTKLPGKVENAYTLLLKQTKSLIALGGVSELQNSANNILSSLEFDSATLIKKAKKAKLANKASLYIFEIHTKVLAAKAKLSELAQ